MFGGVALLVRSRDDGAPSPDGCVANDHGSLFALTLIDTSHLLLSTAGHVGLRLLKQQSTVRAVCIAVYLVHVLEGVYAFRVARQAGHRDAAPGWFAQTFLLGFPSVFLVNDLKRREGTSERVTSDGGEKKTPGS